ncbi:TPA: hypothetical protein LC301_004973, partial [Salmonella enterica subsp. enterica serovar Veneziana]|nr:hypothetical protein [Salmonella enterica subsp. enterica serovar Veneziana]
MNTQALFCLSLPLVIAGCAQQTSTSAPHARLTFPVEQPCFRVKKVSLSGTERLPGWVPLHRLAEQVRGHCVGVKG